MRNMFLIVGFAVQIIALVVIGPLATIWAFNTLFPILAIPYSWQTWLAVLVIGAFLKGSVTYKK